MSTPVLNSSTELARLSVGPQRAALFLERLANLDVADSSKLWSFAERFEDILPKNAPEPTLGHIPDDFFRRFGVRSRFLKQAQEQLRALWREQAPLLKEANLMILAGRYMQECQPPAGTEGIPVDMRGILGLTRGPDRFLMVLLYALKHVHLLRYCANPDCREPYFVAQRASQIYCGGPCAAPAQREYKIRWWREYGAARRKKLSKKQRGSGGQHAKTKKA
jgi:hypothetical protein